MIVRPASSLAQDRESSPVKDHHCATPPHIIIALSTREEFQYDNDNDRVFNRQ